MVGNKHQRLLKVEFNKVTQLVKWASSSNQIRSVSFYKKDKIELLQILPQLFGQLNCLFHFLIESQLENVSLVSLSSHHTLRRLTKVKMWRFYTLMTVIIYRPQRSKEIRSEFLSNLGMNVYKMDTR